MRPLDSEWMIRRRAAVESRDLWPHLAAFTLNYPGSAVCVCARVSVCTVTGSGLPTLTRLLLSLWRVTRPSRCANDVVITSHHASLQARACMKLRCQGSWSTHSQVFSPDIHSAMVLLVHSGKKKAKMKEKVRNPCSRMSMSCTSRWCVLFYVLSLFSLLPLINVELSQVRADGEEDGPN